MENLRCKIDKKNCNFRTFFSPIHCVCFFFVVACLLFVSNSFLVCLRGMFARISDRSLIDRNDSGIGAECGH